MSKNTQQEIASPYECDSTNKKELNAIFLHIGILACLIVFFTGLTVYVSKFGDVDGFMPLISLIFAIPVLIGCVYSVCKLVKAKNSYALIALLGGLVLIACLSLMQIFIPSNAFKQISVFMFCLLLLIAAAAPLLITVNIKKIRARELSGIITILFLTCISVLLLIYFKDFTSKGFGFQLWKGKVFKIFFKSMVLTYAGVVFFSVCVIFLTAYLFMEKKGRITTKYITYVATFAALSVLFKMMGNAVTNTLPVLGPMFKFTLVYIPWVAAGIVTGPAGAMVATGIGDLLGQILLPSGTAWFWLTGLSNILFPLFPALIYKYVRAGKKFDWLKILVGMMISSVVCTLGLGTLAISIMYDSDYFANLATRPIQLIVIGINYALLVALLPALRRAKLPNLSLKPARAQT